MLVSFRYFLKPEDILFLKFMLFRGDVISCDCFFNSRKNKGWHHRL